MSSSENPHHGRRTEERNRLIREAALFRGRQIPAAFGESGGRVAAPATASGAALGGHQLEPLSAYGSSSGSALASADAWQFVHDVGCSPQPAGDASPIGHDADVCVLPGGLGGNVGEDVVTRADDQATERREIEYRRATQQRTVGTIATARDAHSAPAMRTRARSGAAGDQVRTAWWQTSQPCSAIATGRQQGPGEGRCRSCGSIRVLLHTGHGSAAACAKTLRLD